jgi:5-methylthioadenosine/S-adenosylhomocysteine deaminase
VSLTILDARLDGRPVGLRCDSGGRIAALGPEVANGHTHAAMTLFRGYGGDLPLMRWLEEKIWPIEESLEEEDVYWGTRLACAEMIRTGTTRFWDMYWHPTATARAVRDSGLRAVVGGPLFDVGGGSAGARETALADLDRLAAETPDVDRALAPHAIYTVSEGLLRWSVETAAERGIAIQIHLSETEREVSECVGAHGVRPAEYLDRVGLLGERTVLAHGVWLDNAELELIAERGCTVVTNPVANMKLAVGGVFPYPRAREAEVAVGLGTDGAGSNDSLDLLSDLKAFALAQRHAAGDATVIAAAEAWEVATGVRAPGLGSTGLAVGGPADFLLLRPGSPELGLGDLASDLVYAASGSVVDTTVVGGRVLMRGGVVEGVEEIVARAAERAAGLGIGT